MIKSFEYKGKQILFEITNPEDHLQKYWLAGHFYEEGMLNYIYQRWTNVYAPVVVDVGACIGNHTIFFAKVMRAYVYAFEPVPENMALIRRNAELNGVMAQIFFIQKGAGSVRTRVKFQPDTTGNSGMGKITPDGCDRIDLIPMDQVIKPSHEVDILKIDVEGYNIPVLEGARHTIQQYHPDIFIECQTPEELHEVEDFLLPRGYKCHPTVFNRTPTYLFYYTN